jgi:hypothetical protein
MPTQTLINLVVGGGVSILLAVFLIIAFGLPKYKRISMLLQGLAFIAFFAGDAISNGSSPRYESHGGARAYLTGDGPCWGILAGVAAAVVLLIIAHDFEKKD